MRPDFRPGLFLLLLTSAGSARALSLTIRNVEDDAPAAGISFSNVRGESGRHHTARQYLEVAHPPSRFRKVYLYTDNGGALGISKEGLVNVLEPAFPEVPFYWKNFPGRPAPFTPATEGEWTALLEKSRPEFSVPAVKDARALLTPAADGFSRVGLAIKTAAEPERGNYVAHLVLEESSDVDDVAGPEVAHAPFHDVILIDIPIGVETPALDDGSVVSSTFYFRLDGAGDFLARPAALTPDPGNPFRWFVKVSLDPGDVHEGLMEYYFIVRDNFDNETQTPVYRANLVPVDGAVTRTVPAEGGVETIPVGDPSQPGFTVTFPPDSLSGPQTLSVSLRPSSDYPGVGDQETVRVFELGPDGVRFARPVTLALPYLDQDQDGTVDGTSIDETTLRVYWFDGHLWRYVGGQVDTAANQVRATVTHFSVYGLAPLAQALTPEMVRPQEKILTPNGDGQNDFAQFNITGEFEIEFFDLRGDRVRRLSGVNTWDGRDDDGRLVETGTYIYRLRGQGLTVTGALAVAR